MSLLHLAPEAPLSSGDQVTLFGGCARFLKSGLPLPAGLAHLGEHASGRLRAVAERLRRTVELEGRSLTDAFRRHVAGIGPFELALLEHGEAAGRLDQTFRELESLARSRVERRGQLLRDLAYPAFLAIVFMLLWPVPALVSDGAAAYLVRALPPLALAGVAAWLAIAVWPRVTLGGELAAFLDRRLLALPWLGGAFRGRAQARFGRALALLVRAGIPMDRAVDLAVAAAGCPTLRRTLERLDTAGAVRRGARLSDALAPAGEILSSTFLAALKSGETSGDLDGALAGIADLLDEEARTRLDVAMRLVGPSVYLVVAAGIAIYVVHTYLARFAMLDAIR
jgi:type II secretory pathway component PulF